MRRLPIGSTARADGRPEGADVLAQTDGAKPTVAEGHVDEVGRNDGMRTSLPRFGQQSLRSIRRRMRRLFDRFRPTVTADEIDRAAVAQPVAGDNAADDDAGHRRE